MLPENYDDVLTEDFDETTIPDLTFEFNLERKVIEGFVDETEAVKQAIFMILSTERFNYVIYSWDYGFESMELYGCDYELLQTILKDNISEALLQDDRINSVTNFGFERGRKFVKVNFTAETIYGDVEIEKTFEEV